MMDFLEGENVQAWDPEALQRYFDGFALVGRRMTSDHKDLK
jgi:hypothetical protein